MYVCVCGRETVQCLMTRMYVCVWKRDCAVTGDSSTAVDGPGRHVVMINVSPIDYGHVLLVPHLDSCLPQVGLHIHTHTYTCC